MATLVAAEDGSMDPSAGVEVVGGVDEAMGRPGNKPAPSKMRSGGTVSLPFLKTYFEIPEA